MVKDRGDKTVKKYLIDDAGMASTLANVDEFGPRGEFWTSTKANTCGLKYLLLCRQTVSTNNAYVRDHATPLDSSEPKFFSFLVAGLSDQERTRYQFLWQ